MLWIDCIYILWVVSHDIRRRREAFESEDELSTGKSYRETFKDLPLAPLILVICAVALLLLTALVFYHYYLASVN